MGCFGSKPAQQGTKGNNQTADSRLLTPPKWTSQEPLTRSQLDVSPLCVKCSQALLSAIAWRNACEMAMIPTDCGNKISHDPALLLHPHPQSLPWQRRSEQHVPACSRAFRYLEGGFRSIRHTESTKFIILSSTPSEHLQAAPRLDLQRMREEFWETSPHYGGDRGVPDCTLYQSTANHELHR